MINIYVHLRVVGLPDDALEDDDFLDALWREVADASISGAAGAPAGITLSQFALTDRAATRRQRGRVQRALAAIGWPAATVEIDDVIREDVRDDIDAVLGAVSWRARKLLGRERCR
jgi:hypothetical protein